MSRYSDRVPMVFRTVADAPNAFSMIRAAIHDIGAGRLSTRGTPMTEFARSSPSIPIVRCWIARELQDPLR
jgi:hypothetical protein